MTVPSPSSRRPRRPGVTVVVLVTAVLAAVIGTRGGAAGDPTPDPARWQLVWRDEFTGAAGTRPDPGNWGYDLGGEPQWGNHEWQYYTDRPANVALDGQGHLVISARREQLPGMTPCPDGPCDVTSGRITTLGHFAQTYGRFEARMKIPAGKGLWPAFWMMGTADRPWPDNGEIDVMETIADDPGTVYGSAHGPGFADPGYSQGHTGSARLADDFHTYAVEWGPDRIDWFLDDTLYYSLGRSQLKPEHTWVFDQPFHLLLNLAVGGGWPGPPASDTAFPADLLVDYVRVYRAAGR
ncbi:family 16 glycosylhydrolase [Nocardia sp. alder85J]|uniref:glycoside hydrolase family 16 protein n=1 Tax=Nocardia sp. alder85J TaxID=2862949 RepID=UPI001CD3F652|nr:glycoside hydrolase family 16 protein [Nocardia sp. alder85J]MCX4094895.1 glycoside hydrolase family 16 protein [Nocardia sp. alder85J]